MSELKRYRHDVPAHGTSKMISDPEGTYVKYEDVEAYVNLMVTKALEDKAAMDTERFLNACDRRRNEQGSREHQEGYY